MNSFIFTKQLKAHNTVYISLNLRCTKFKNVFQKCFAGSTGNARIINLATLVRNIT